MSSKPLLLKTQAEYSSGLAKLPLGKIDPRLMRIIVNSGKGMVLHDSTWTKTAANIDQGKTIDLDIRSNAVTDKSGNSNHPALSNVTLLNGEMQFNGTTSIATITRNAGIETTSFSIFVRLRLNSWGTVFTRIAEKITNGNGGFLINIDNSTGKTSFAIYASDGTSSAIPSVASLQLNTVYDLVFAFEKYVGSGLGRLTIYVNGVLDSQGECSKVYAVGTSDVLIGNKSDLSRALNGSIYALRMYDYTLSPAEAKALSDQRSALYPSQDSLTFTITQTSVKKLSIDGLYLDNQLEESPTAGDVLEIIDDNQASFWSKTGTAASITLTNEATIKQKGIDSLKVIFTNTPQFSGIQRYIGADWSTWDFLSFYMYGANSGKIFIVELQCPDNANKRGYGITDNFSGWKKIVIALRAMSITGSPNFATTGTMKIYNYSAENVSFTWYLDRMVLQKGRWAYLELATPDQIYKFANYLSASSDVIDWNYIVVSLWDGSTYQAVSTFESIASAQKYFNTNVAKFLNGQTLKAVYGETQNYNSLLSAVECSQGVKGQTVSRVNTSRMPNNTAVPNGAGGTKKRVIVGFKMPPADGLASASAGISQVKLKLEVYAP